MPRFNPRGGGVPANGNDTLNDDFNEDFLDILEDSSEQEEWEQYLERMSPRDRRADEEAAAPEKAIHSSDGESTGAAWPEAKPKKRRKVTFGSVLLVILVLAVVAGAVLYFGTDLYYVAKVEMKRVSVDLFVGEETDLVCDVVSVGSGEPEMVWSSSEPSVASVGEEGGVTALSAGRATVTVSDPVSGRRAQCLVNVHNVDELVLSSESITLGAGESLRLSVQAGTRIEEPPYYSSGDSGVAVADADGIITAVEPGETDIVISCRGFNDAMCHVTVLSSPTVMETQVEGAMCRGESRQMTVTLGEGEFSAAYQYSSSDPTVASVDENGVINALQEGTASITCTAFNGVSCTLPVSVGEEAGGITVPKKLTAYNGIAVNIGASDDTGLCRQFYYNSSDPSVVEVDEQGGLRVLKNGEATVTCTTYNGHSAKCAVTAKIVDYKTPYNSERVRENIAALAAAYPELITTEVIGASSLGQDITLLTLGTGQRKVLVVAGMHAKEDITVSYTMRCIDEYVQALASGSRYGKYNIKKLLEEYTIYFVPLLNPDGLDICYGDAQPLYTDQPLTDKERDTYKNTATGVNLNRNFPFEWGYKGINVTEPDARSYAGSSAGSEPETQAIIELCAKHEFEWLLDMHCKGHLAYYQDKVTGETAEARKLARRLYDRCGFTLTDQSTKKEISGGLENWFRKEYGRPGLCVELVPSKYSTEVNEYFDSKTVWKDTKYVFLMCLED